MCDGLVLIIYSLLWTQSFRCPFGIKKTLSLNFLDRSVSTRSHFMGCNSQQNWFCSCFIHFRVMFGDQFFCFLFMHGMFFLIPYSAGSESKVLIMTASLVFPMDNPENPTFASTRKTLTDPSTSSKALTPWWPKTSFERDPSTSPLPSISPLSCPAQFQGFQSNNSTKNSHNSWPAKTKHAFFQILASLTAGGCNIFFRRDLMILAFLYQWNIVVEPSAGWFLYTLDFLAVSVLYQEPRPKDHKTLAQAALPDKEKSAKICAAKVLF